MNVNSKGYFWLFLNSLSSPIHPPPPSSPLFPHFPVHLPTNYFITIFKLLHPLPYPFYPPSALPHSRQHVLPKTPLFLTMAHTQRSAPTNHITRSSANLTSHTRPQPTIYKSSTRLLISLVNSLQYSTAPMKSSFYWKLKCIPKGTSTLVQHIQILKLGS